MLKIDKTTFSFNLGLTQEYCRTQLAKNESDNAKVFRSFNPMVNGRPLFSFVLEQFDFNIQPDLNSCTLAKWATDPQGPGNEYVINRLFEEQMNFKQQNVSFEKQQIYDGDILISEVDYTVIDGASEVQSLGLIDIYDMPPTDTWFYLMKDKETRLLFAWIPKEYEYHVNEAISVNFLDIINWFKDLYPEDYKNLMTR